MSPLPDEPVEQQQEEQEPQGQREEPLKDLDKLDGIPISSPGAVWTDQRPWYREWDANRPKYLFDADGQPSAVHALEQRNVVTVLHPAQDVFDDALWYGVPTPSGVVMVNSRRESLLPEEMPPGVALKHQSPPACAWSHDSLLAFVRGTAGEPKLSDLLDRLRDRHFRKYMIFADGRVAVLLSAWTVGTYVYRLFHVYPYLHLRSPDKRCGKTRLLKLLSAVSFNSSGVQSSLTEAVLYRSAEQSAGVQLLDEMERLSGKEDLFAALIAILNSGFEKGGSVPRMQKDGDAMRLIQHEVYAPRAIAGIAGLTETLEDRSIPGFLNRKHSDEDVDPLSLETLAVAGQVFQDLCYTTALIKFPVIADLHKRRTVRAQLRDAGLDDRAVDLWEPIITVAAVADAEDGGTRSTDLIDLAKDLAVVRESNDEEATAVRLIKALKRAPVSPLGQITPSDLLAHLRSNGFHWIASTKRLAVELNPMGLYSRKTKKDAKVFRVYEIDPAALDDLERRYSPDARQSAADSAPAAPGPAPETKTPETVKPRKRTPVPARPFGLTEDGWPAEACPTCDGVRWWRPYGATARPTCWSCQPPDSPKTVKACWPRRQPAQ